MGAREKESKTQGPSKAAPPSGQSGARPTRPVQDQMELPLEAPVAPQAAQSAIADLELEDKPVETKIPAFFMGKRVEYMAILFRRAAFFMPENEGYHELTRIIVGSNGKVRCTDRDDSKLGTGLVRRVSVDAVGCTVELTTGTVFAPLCDIQLTYR